MEFAQPWMLFGLLAALLPVAIHFLGRRRAEPVQFSAFALLVRIDPTRAARIKVRERALLTFRMVAVGLVALILAKPLVPQAIDANSVVAANAPVAAVLIVDDSMSMGVQSGGGPTRFEAAKSSAQRLIGQLPIGSQVAVVASGFPARAVHARLQSDVASVADDVRAMTWGPRSDDAKRAFDLAAQILATAALADRRIVVLSDLQKPAWPPLAPRSGDVGPRVAAEAIQLLAKDNASIVAAEVEPATARGPRHARVSVSVKFGAVGNRGRHLTLSAGQREWRRWLEPSADGAQRSFIVPVDHDAAVATLPDDDLAADNRLDILLGGSDRVRIALVNGAARPVPREDEVFFIAQALKLARGRRQLDVTTLSLADVAETRWEQFDVMVLANVAELPAATLKALDARVQEGAGLLVAAGDTMPSDASSWPSQLLPWTLAGTRTGLAAGVGGGLELALDRAKTADSRDKSLAYGHQALRQAMDGLAGAKVTQHVLVSPSAARGADVVVRFLDGAPALLLAKRGKGRVALWTTTVDRDWSDVALQPGFLPLVTAWLQALSAGTVDATSRQALPGQPVVVPKTANADQLVVRGAPDGPIVARAALNAADSGVRFLAPLQPGAYTVVQQSASAVWSSRPLLVVAPATEANINDLDDPERWRLSPGDSADAPARQRTPAWPQVIVLMIVVMLLEATMLVRMTRARVPTPGEYDAR